MSQLLWFRTDLRVRDNTALHAALKKGPTLAIFIISPKQWLLHDEAPCKVDFWLRQLAVLQLELQRLHIPLLIRYTEDWNQIPSTLSDVCSEHRIRAIHVNQEYGVNEAQRDQQTEQHLQTQGVSFHSYVDRVLFTPGSLRTRTGGYFKVFSQFKNACYQRLALALPSCLELPSPQAPLAVTSDPIPSQIADFETPSATLRSLWPVGETVALERLTQFTSQALLSYDSQRDFPALPGTSQLSPYLTAGILSVRQCLNAALQQNQGQYHQGNIGVVTWITELLWREFYIHVLVGFPEISKHRAFRAQTEAIAWRHAPEELAAWQQGQTGFPLIDAAMRQLHATGWMHNRLRMVVAMFLSKNLLIDWRHGERFFMQHLMDGDLAANNGGWQWSASTGTDAVPWFRLFNPITQSQRFDPQGQFIRHWIPELAHLDNQSIHNPSTLGGLFGVPNYPHPLVDLAASRERALNAFKQLS